ncbi:hypothetical protein [Yoonia sp.]|uniref:hypothetical protein n=1 Tax=Yoonia sp. TaxID=2212373 RepID=UPI003A4DD898
MVFGADDAGVSGSNRRAGADYLAMPTALSPDGVDTATSATGTSAGAALLARASAAKHATQAVPLPDDAAALRAYAQRWARQVQSGSAG